MPGSFQTGSGGVPNTQGLPAVRSFGEVVAAFEYPYSINGITKDATGAALPNCSLVLLRTADNSVAALGSSDGSGNYRLGASNAIPHYVVAYLPGSPDVAGTTVDTLVGT